MSKYHVWSKLKSTLAKHSHSLLGMKFNKTLIWIIDWLYPLLMGNLLWMLVELSGYRQLFMKRLQKILSRGKYSTENLKDIPRFSLPFVTLLLLVQKNWLQGLHQKITLSLALGNLKGKSWSQREVVWGVCVSSQKVSLLHLVKTFMIDFLIWSNTYHFPSYVWCRDTRWLAPDYCTFS